MKPRTGTQTLRQFAAHRFEASGPPYPLQQLRCGTQIPSPVVLGLGKESAGLAAARRPLAAARERRQERLFATRHVVLPQLVELGREVHGHLPRWKARTASGHPADRCTKDICALRSAGLACFWRHGTRQLPLRTCSVAVQSSMPGEQSSTDNRQSSRLSVNSTRQPGVDGPSLCAGVGSPSGSRSWSPLSRPPVVGWLAPVASNVPGASRSGRGCADRASAGSVPRMSPTAACRKS